MTALKTLKALEDSIVLFERALKDPEHIVPICGWAFTNFGVYNPLCKMFYGDSKSPCIGCPVLEKTGYHSCENTPWSFGYYQYHSEYVRTILEAERISGKINPEYLIKLRLEVCKYLNEHLHLLQSLLQEFVGRM